MLSPQSSSVGLRSSMSPIPFAAASPFAPLVNPDLETMTPLFKAASCTMDASSLT